MGANLRTALIAAIKRSEDGSLWAEGMLAGRSVLAWQAELALALACERIICLCDNVSDTILSLQRAIEGEGGEFHAVRTNLQLVSMVRADDELVMIADGLLADPETVRAFALHESDILHDTDAVQEAGSTAKPMRKGIATLAAGHRLAEAHPMDFERIDRERHWAGLAVIRAGQVEQLADLPPDGDAMSLLLRLALQGRLACRALPSDALENEHGDARWMLACNTAALAERERALLNTNAPAVLWTGPGDAIADTVAREIAPRWIEKGPELSALAAGAFALGGVALSGFGYGVVGLLVAAMGAFGGALSGAWASVRARLWSRATSARLDRGVRLSLEVAAIVALILASGILASGVLLDPIVKCALAVLAVGLSQLAGRGSRTAAKAFWRDRTVHLIGFAVAAGAGYLTQALAVFAIAALAVLLLRR